MTRKRKPCSPSIQPTPVDPCRPFTDVTWMLLTTMLDEDGWKPGKIAQELKRDPEDVAARIKEAEENGTLARMRERLRGWRRMYPRRFRG